jgi:hypothetical protein
MTHAVRRRPRNTEARFQSQLSPFGICGGQSDADTSVSPIALIYPVSIIPPLIHVHAFIYNRRYVTLANNSIVK